MRLYFGRAPRRGPGFPFQGLATRISWLQAFHCNPSRMRHIPQGHRYHTIKDPQWYAAQWSPEAAHKPNQGIEITQFLL